MSSVDEITEVLARQIRERRGQLNLTQTEAARRLRVSERTLQNWEAAASFPRPKHRRRLARFLDQGLGTA